MRPICSNMDGRMIRLSKGNQRKTNVMISFIWRILTSDTDALTKLKQTHRHRKQTYNYQRRGINWELGMNS